jgi:hypothetical protein
VANEVNAMWTAISVRKGLIVKVVISVLAIHNDF